jgi:hypothetical protein
MGLMDKMKFWKKDSDDDDIFNFDSIGPQPGQPPKEQQRGFQNQQMQQDSSQYPGVNLQQSQGMQQNPKSNDPFSQDSFADDPFMKDPLAQDGHIGQEPDSVDPFSQSNNQNPSQMQGMNQQGFQQQYPSMKSPQLDQPDSDMMQPVDPFAMDPVKQNQQYQEQSMQQPLQMQQQMQRPMLAQHDPYSDHGDHTISKAVKGHEMELIITKLDTLKAMMEGISQRLENLERSGRDDYSKGRW